MDEKKKTPDEEEQKAPAAPEEKSEPPKADENPPEEKPEQEPAPAEEPPKEETPKEEPEPDAPEEEPAPEVPAEDPKDKEILQLKTQIAAMKLGIQADCVEDAVAVAEMLVSTGKSDSVDAALTAVVKKYPNMKGGDGGKKSGGFKIGAGSSESSDKPDTSRLSSAFGIKKKK